MPKKLAIGGCLAIVMILAMIVLIGPSPNEFSFSNRLCPTGYYASFYGTQPLYRGGVAEQFNLRCIKKGQPIYAEHTPFVRDRGSPFGRTRQDSYAMMYNG